ncbi:P-loop containing nucleoside triphosphate hydrolase protein [Staphylotrichum tortipilum]|uniref:P-loop containing nucleoside triphosphate hydrolase protein n=1 Tax=Staphylotrichum tortipilum TaxID=2831512 RepID=A0AAN6MU23_9PEZI|nr:P-loop containing nucleoside triphosphate hydrolase protein [Staphylotrichum longicolle]
MANASPTDIYIALMGVTGVGKSAFISRCTSQTVVIGDGLQSCTSRVQTYSFAYSPSVTVHLVDTPGFDDTNRKDSDVLREISGWLSESYTHKVLLSGILYLHRISDMRMQGSGKMNLGLLHKLCGNGALKKVILVTTMWDREDPAVGEQRERELAATPEFWGFCMQHGSQIRRHYNNEQSALNIISLFVPQAASAAPETITLDIQRELTDEHKTLDQTGAGQILASAWASERAALQQELQEVREAMRSASEERDATMAQLLQEQQQEMNRVIDDLRQEQERLRVTVEQLHAERLKSTEEMLFQQRSINQSLSQDLERMRLVESDRQAEIERARNEQPTAEEQADWDSNFPWRGQTFEAPTRLSRAAARFQESERGRMAVNAGVAAGKVKARVTGESVNLHSGTRVGSN